tara:strand:+ start:6441 stop:6959 length:519 start_codon:yes stop_codon:yes gene_type:complete
MTYYIYKGHDNGPVLAIAEGIQEARKIAKRVSRQLGLITIRDCLGGIHTEIEMPNIKMRADLVDIEITALELKFSNYEGSEAIDSISYVAAFRNDCMHIAKLSQKWSKNGHLSFGHVEALLAIEKYALKLSNNKYNWAYFGQSEFDSDCMHIADRARSIIDNHESTLTEGTF